MKSQHPPPRPEPISGSKGDLKHRSQHSSKCAADHFKVRRMTKGAACGFNGTPTGADSSQGSRCTIGTTERRLNLGSSFLNADSDQSSAKGRENPSGSEGWHSDCLSSRLTLDAVLLHVLYRGAELRRASPAPDSLRGSPTAYL